MYQRWPGEALLDLDLRRLRITARSRDQGMAAACRVSVRVV